LYVLYKFGEIWFSDSGVYDVRKCTASDDHFTGDGTIRHDGDQQSDVFHYYSLGDDISRPDGLHARLCQAFLVLLSYSKFIIFRSFTCMLNRSVIETLLSSTYLRNNLFKLSFP